MLLFILAALAGDPLSHEDSRLRVDVPEGWVGAVSANGDGVDFTLSRPGDLPPYIRITHWGDLQLDLPRLDPFEMLATETAEEGEIIGGSEPDQATVPGMGPARASRSEHDTLGPILTLDLLEPVQLAERDYQRRHVYAEIGGATVAIELLDESANGSLDEEQAMVLAALSTTERRVPWERHQTGEVVLDGFRITLPEGWRAGTQRERGRMFKDPSGRSVVFLDARSVSPTVRVGCEVYTPRSPGRFHAPAKVPDDVAGFHAMVQAAFQDEDEPPTGEVTQVWLGDRPAHRWMGRAAPDGPTFVESITTMGDDHIDCVFYGMLDTPRGQTAMAVMDSIRIDEPWSPDLYDTYVRLWPLQSPVPHPFWFLGPLAVMSAFGLGWTVSRVS